MSSASYGALVLALFLAACSTVGSAQDRRPPTRPGQSAVSSSAPAAKQNTPAPKAAPKGAASQVRAKDWVAADVLATRLGMKFSWVQEGRQFQLKGANGTFAFELDTRECDLAGLRSFLGEAVREVKGKPAFSKIDAETLITPLARPGYGQSARRAPKVIVLDPGHGGADSGMINPKLKLLEKTLALDTAQRLRKLLEGEGYKVYLTRNDDRFIELADRPEVAEKVHADLFVSIHFNSVEQGADKVTGIEVFTMTPRYQLSTDQKPDPVYADVKNPGNENDHWNTLLGASLHRRLLGQLKVSDRGLKRGRLAVLRLAECPAVLVEGGYLSNDEEARKISIPSYRQQIAEAIAAGIRDYDLTLTTIKRRD